MVLSTINNRVQSNRVYPDRITINYQYNMSKIMSSYDLLPQIRDACNLTKVPGKQAVRGKIQFNEAGHMLEVYVTRPTRFAPLSISVYLNPLAYIHALGTQEIEDEVDEWGRNGWTNWVAAHEVETDNSWIWDIAGELIFRAETVTERLAHDIARAIDASAALQNITIRDVEVALDIAADDPGDLVRRFEVVFQERSSRPTTHNYRPASFVSEIDGDSFMLSGYARNGERYKVYEKTNRRIRLECQLDANRVTNILRRQPNGDGANQSPGSRSIMGGEDEFHWKFGQLAEYVAPVFEEILREMRQDAPAGGSPIEFLANVCSTIRRVTVAQDLIRILVRNGRIRSAFDHNVTRRLIARNILRRSARGNCAVVPRYRAAIRTLREADINWRTRGPRERRQ